MTEDTRTLAAESCLNHDQHGYNAEELERPEALDGSQVAGALAQTAIDSATDELMDAMGMEVASVAPPPIFRSLQCRGATPMARGKSNIDSIVLHTPEGYESGTLSVLSGTAAGFDFYLPPNGRLYKCNDYLRNFSWHAGDLAYNRRSIGIEQWDFAARMDEAGDDHYGRLGRLCAYLVETLDLSIRYAASYGGYGFIFHRTITPGARCDPDACGKSKFNTDKLLDIVSDLVGGKSDPTKPDPRPGGKTVHRVKLAADLKKGTQVFSSGTDKGAQDEQKRLKSVNGIETVIEKA